MDSELLPRCGELPPAPTNQHMEIGLSEAEPFELSQEQGCTVHLRYRLKSVCCPGTVGVSSITISGLICSVVMVRSDTRSSLI